ncbi:uncharacterized protein [Amphiura filiformis]|uniref:uncharacterized protein n=1 Tax=Amphiura filiformis TaxID=82378 RepID=UPI003B21827F
MSKSTFDTLTIKTYQNETCDTVVSSSNNQGITVNVLWMSSWSIFDYFTLVESGAECLNQSFGWIGFTAAVQPCAIVLNCSTIRINMRVLSILEIQESSMIASTTNFEYVKWFDTGNLRTFANFKFQQCKNVHIVDEIYQMPYQDIPYVRLQELYPSLNITLDGYPYFKPDANKLKYIPHGLLWSDVLAIVQILYLGGNTIKEVHVEPDIFSQIQELNPSLKITLEGDPYFKPDELPGFDLDLPDDILLAEFPKCPNDCFCTLQFQIFFIDCPDMYVSENILLVHGSSVFIHANSTATDLSDRQLTNIEPQSFLNRSDVIVLLLSRNKMTRIGPGIFEGLENIHTLDLSFNQISSIDAGSFSHLYKLKQLILNVNKLQYISHSWLDGLVNVQTLYLGGNIIKEVEKDIFSQMRMLKVLSFPDCHLSQMGNLPNSLILLDIASNIFSHIPTSLPRNLTHLSLDNNHLSFLNQTILYGKPTLISLVLSHNNLSVIPSDLFSHLYSLERLNLGNNSIESFPSGVFRDLQQLRVFSMYGNKLNVIQSDIFNNLNKLELIDLSNNSIKSLSSGVFRDLQQLKVLNLYGNKLNVIQSDLFNNLTKIEILNFGNNSIESLPSGIFRDLHQLRGLDLYGNKLTVIQNDLFNHLTKLEILGLNENNIKSLPSDVFRDFHQLQRLYLYRNKFNVIHSGIFNSFTKLEILGLNENNINSLPSGVFRDLHQVQKLLLYGNKLNVIQNDLFNNLTKLELLHLGNNSIDSLPSGVFRYLHQLQELYLYGNKLNVIQSDLFNNLTTLDKLHLGKNSIDSLPSGVFKDLHQLQELYLYGNKLNVIQSDLFNNLTKLHYLHLGNNSIESLPSGVFRYLHLLYRLYLYGNKLNVIQSDLFNNLTKLDKLHLANNRIESLPTGVFRDLHQLDELYLYRNKLSVIQSDLFNSLTKMRLLSLENNNIESLPSGVFRDLQNLRKLWLSGNKFSVISIDLFSGLTKIEELRLHANEIESLPSAVFKDLKSLKGLHLYENRLTEIPRDVFHQFNGMPIEILTINSSKLVRLYPYQFANLTDLMYLDISSNELKQIPNNALNGLTKLKYINLAYNNLTKVTENSFVGLNLQNNSYIKVDNPATCCFLEIKSQSQCVPRNEKSPYLTCKQPLPSTTVKCCTWIFGFCALFANTVVFIWGYEKIKSTSTDEKQVKQVVFLTNLALADLLMGVYLLVIASVDQYYSEYFPSFAEHWRNSVLCKLAGFLSVLSSEASLLFLTLIAVDRLWTFRKIFITHKLFGKLTQVLMAIIAWVIAFALSIVTIILQDDKLYQFSDVCIGLPLAKTKIYEDNYENITILYDFDRYDDHLQLQTFTEIDSKLGNYFSIGLFLGLNFLLCESIVSVM